MFFNRTLLYNSFKITLKEYFQKTSLNGFGLLYYIRKRKYQRLFWFTALLYGFSFAACVAFVNVTNFIQNPTVTALAPIQPRIFQTPFPAIAVCSANKISRRKAEIFAKELSQRIGYRQKYWLKNIRLFAGFYEDQVSDFDDAIAFELKLQRAFGAEYDIASILKNLAPSCEELLIKCHLAGKERNCSELFKMVPTVTGHCCIFNRREEHIVTDFRKTYYPTMIGLNKGLTLLLNTSTDDYFYKGRSMNGYILQIFDVHNFPDISVGGVRELLISPGTDVRVQLLIVSQLADDKARKFNYERRRCFFEDENLTDGKLAYSQAECLHRCRFESSASICECIPYYTPKEFLEGMKNVTVCSLINFECMTAFYVTWRVYRPKEWDCSKQSQLQSLSCGNCFPLCTFNNYYYEKESARLENTRYSRMNRKFSENIANKTQEVSLVRVYFQNSYATQYNKKVLYNWYQIMSNIGGVLGISIGGSIISGFELFYFFFYRFIVNYRKLRKI